MRSLLALALLSWTSALAADPQLTVEVASVKPVGPGRVRSEQFEIQATAGSSATEDQMKLIAQALLAERFGLKLHRETEKDPIEFLVIDSVERPTPN